MVLPLILRGLAFAAPKIIRFVPKIVKRIPSKKQIISGLITAATLPSLAGLLLTPLGRRTARQVFDPVKGFERGKATPEFVSGIVTKIKEPTTKLSEFDLTEALKKAGLIGAGAALAGGTIITGKKVIERFREKEVILGRGLPAAPFPVTARALAPVRQPPTVKPVVLEAMPQPKPIMIRNVFKPSINVSFRKSKRFINQQILIK